MPPSQKLVVNCAAWGARAYFHDADVWATRAAEARGADDDATAAHCERQAEACRVAGRNGLAAAGLPDDPTIQPETYVDLTPEELEQRKLDEAAGVEQAWVALRTQRNALLTACDWTQLPSAILAPTAKARWDTYRQELRDITETTDNPADPRWPEAPG